MNRTLIIALVLGGCSLPTQGALTGDSLDGARVALDSSQEDGGMVEPMDGETGLRDASTDTGEALDASPVDSGQIDSGNRDSGLADSGAMVDPCSEALEGDAGPIGFCHVAPVDWRLTCPSECDTVGCWGTWHDAGARGNLIRCE